MAQPLRLTEENKRTLMEKVCAEILGWKSVKQVKSLVLTQTSFDVKDAPKVTLEISSLAWQKMRCLVSEFSSEVAWHGTCFRTDTGFRVEDIIVYPQEVTGATVKTDQKKYSEWLMDLDDEVFSGVRFQGHSHVNMGVYASGVDTAQQESILDQLTGEEFFVFVITNKREEMYVRIGDARTNLIYETADVDVSIEGAEFDRKAFISEAKSLVSEEKTSHPVTTGGFYDDSYGTRYWERWSEDDDRKYSLGSFAKKNKKQEKKTVIEGRAK